MYCDTTSRITCSRVERLSALLAFAAFREAWYRRNSVKSKIGPLTDGPAEKTEYGPTCPGNPGNILVPPNCARILTRCHCSVTPSCACGSSSDSAIFLSCSLCAAVRTAICRRILFQRERHRLVQ